MKNLNQSIRIVAFLFLLGLGALPLMAEVSLNGGSGLYIQAHDGRIWAPVRKGLSGAQVLNPQGDRRGDLFGSWSLNPVTGLPEVVWSRNEGGQYEVVFSYWVDGAWRGPVALSESAANDLTPVLYHDANGARYVLWTAWTEDGSQALLSYFGPGAPVVRSPHVLEAAGNEGRYPSALVTDWSLLTVHEERRGEQRFLQVLEFPLYRSSPASSRSTPMENPFNVGQVGLEDGGGNNASNRPLSAREKQHEGIGRPQAPEAELVPTAPLVHAEAGTLWVDWIQDSDTMGAAVHDGLEFGEPFYLDLNGPADEDTTRHRIRQRILRGAGR